MSKCVGGVCVHIPYDGVAFGSGYPSLLVKEALKCFKVVFWQEPNQERW